jgi:Ca-activated chloride channel family protein
MKILQDIKSIVSSFNWVEFHFLRPHAFYLFIPLAVIVILLVAGNKSSTKWKAIIAPHLRSYMFSKGSWWSIALPLASFALGLALIIVGIAGPTWSKEKIPGQRAHAVTLIVLDLSASMLAKDIQPSRLERAKLKIVDFLNANPGSRVGLLAYAGTPHLVLPFTSDYNILKHQAASLLNRAMPVQGTNYALLVEKIDTIMRPVDAPSTVLLLTDAIDENTATALADWTNSTPHHIELVLFSSPGGAPVPGFSKVHSVQEQFVIQNLSQNEKVVVTPLTLDLSDVESVAGRIRKNLVFQKEDEKKEDVWHDRGGLLVFPSLLICLFWFRRGWVIQWCWLLFPLAITSCGIDSKHPDWWYSKNYQGQLLSDAGKYEDAADRFETETYKAVAYYKAGNYEAAADLFELDGSATGTYNRGLALAKLGRYDEAIDAFAKADSLDPAMKDKVNTSMLRARAVRQRADSILKYDSQAGNGKLKSLNEKKDKKNPFKERKAQSKDEELSSDTQVKNLPKFGNRVTDETMSTTHSARELKEPPKDFKLEKATSSTDIILRRSESDPGEFLHRRFELQKKRDYPHVKPSKERW